MIWIQVKYGDTLRRFTACIDDGERRGLNMAGFRAKIFLVILNLGWVWMGDWIAVTPLFLP